MKHVIVHYDEIGLKKGNRDTFERILISNLQKSLKEYVELVKKERGHILLELKDDADKDKVKEILKLFPGIAYFSFAEQTSLEPNDINKTASDLLKNKKGTFRITTARHNKDIKLNSNELSANVGEYVLNNNKNLKVKLKDQDYDLKVEVCNKHTYLSLENIKGISGLPVGTGGKVMCLISGGIDSPVASFMMMKRGMKVVFVHFQNKTQLTRAVEDKIEQLVEQLSKYQLNAKLFIVPFDKLQKEIVTKVNSKYRMIVYRRYMLKIAEILAKREKVKALVTGDSLAQVASQTLQNLSTVYDAATLPILSPLIGLNKSEIINIAEKINTYEISILPYGDCCTFFVAEHPETSAKLDIIQESEKDISEDLIKEAIMNVKIRKIGHDF